MILAPSSLLTFPSLTRWLSGFWFLSADSSEVAVDHMAAAAAAAAS